MRIINRILGLWVVLAFSVSTARAGLVLKDNFNDRILYSSQLQLRTDAGNNVGATQEAGEPNHAGKRGGASVWFSWRAPLNLGGILTISTAGSSFDTLLAVYTGDSLTTLQAVAANDDSGGNLTSQVRFNVQGGQIYQIAIDGMNGATGDISLSWSLDLTSGLLPVITSLTAGQTVGLGEKVSLGVTVDTPLVSFQWCLNGQPIPGAHDSFLGINQAALTDVGYYNVRITALLGLLSITSAPTYLEINRTDDSVDRNAVALDKFADIINQPPSLLAAHRGPGRLDNGPVRGYSGTQMFSTYGATMEPGEPYNCGIKGGSSAWFAFTAPTNGLLYINTDGSSFDTTLGVYLMPPTGKDYSDLIPVACDDNSGTNGRTSAVRFLATAGSTYYVSVDGVAGATGQVVLNYNLGDPLVTVAVPQPKLANAGDSVSLSVGVWGTLPVAYQWAKDGVVITGATNSSLAISNAQVKQAGRYSVSASNLVSTVSNWTTFALYSQTLSLTGQLQNQTVTQGTDASLAVAATGVAPFSYQWFFQGRPLAGATGVKLLLTAVQPGAAGAYQVQVWDANGAQLSALATLTVNPVPALTLQPQSQSVITGSSLTLTAAAAGAPVLAYQWCLGNNLLLNATNRTFSIANFQRTNAGDYTLIVTNAAGAVTSQVASISVLSPPVITQQPQSQSITSGGVSFAVVATGAGPLAYQWRFNGVNIKSATGTKYTISSVKSSDYGNYSVLVTNSAGSVVSATAVLSNGSTTPTPAAVFRPVQGIESSFNATDGSFQFTLPGLPNGPYQIQCSENLREWRSLATTTVTNGLIYFCDRHAANQVSRFYRAVADSKN